MHQILCEFVGGAWDGMNLSTASADPVEAALAAYVLRMTQGGGKGKAVLMPREYALRAGGCRYIVRNHVAVGYESLVRLECDESRIAGPSPAAVKTIVLQFSGGHLQGRTLRTDAADVEQALIAASCFCLADWGAISAVLRVPECLGRRIGGEMCEAASAAYRVVRREEDAGQIRLLLEYLDDRG